MIQYQGNKFLLIPFTSLKNTKHRSVDRYKEQYRNWRNHLRTILQTIGWIVTLHICLFDQVFDQCRCLKCSWMEPSLSGKVILERGNRKWFFIAGIKRVDGLRCWEIVRSLKRFQSVPHEKKKTKPTTRAPPHNDTLLETRIFEVKVTPHLQLLRRNVLKTPGKMLSGNEKKASCLGRKRSTHDANKVWKIRLSFDLTMTMFFLDKKDVVFWGFFPSTIFIPKLHAFPIVNQPLT